MRVVNMKVLYGSFVSPMNINSMTISSLGPQVMFISWSQFPYSFPISTLSTHDQSKTNKGVVREKASAAAAPSNKVEAAEKKVEKLIF